MSIIMAIDPGTFESGYVYYTGRAVADSGVAENAKILQMITDFGAVAAESPKLLAIEMIASYGMPVGAEVFETCVWVGRFTERWEATRRAFDELRYVYRKDVKLHLCGTSKAKDPHIRQRLLDLVGPQGTKKEPGPTFGVKSHAWPALAVAITAADGIGRRITA